MVSQYDDVANIGRRYRRQDEIGTPFCVTVDFQTLEDSTVTVRERDGMTQIRLAIDALPAYLLERVMWRGGFGGGEFKNQRGDGAARGDPPPIPTPPPKPPKKG